MVYKPTYNWGGPILYSYVRLLKGSKAIVHHQYVDALYHSLMVKLGMVCYYCFAHMILDS